MKYIKKTKFAKKVLKFLLPKLSIIKKVLPVAIVGLFIIIGIQAGFVVFAHSTKKQFVKNLPITVSPTIKKSTASDSASFGTATPSAAATPSATVKLTPTPTDLPYEGESTELHFDDSEDEKPTATTTPSQEQTLHLDEISPSSGNSGMNIVLKGVRFTADKGEVVFVSPTNTEYGAPIESWSDTEIKAKVPGILTSNQTDQVYVLVNGKKSNTLSFQVTVGQPRIESLSPETITISSEITISGSGFGTDNGKIKFYKKDGTVVGEGTISSWNDTSVTVSIPTGFAAGDECGVQIIHATGAESSLKFFTINNS